MLLCFCGALLAACSLPAEPEPPAPGTFAAALAAVNRGDLTDYRRELSKHDGLCARARADMARLDSEAWLILHGARWREHDLAACYSAQSDAAMAAAMGFSDDALTSTLLRAPSRQSERYAEARRHFRSVEPPARLFDDLAPKPGPKALAAFVLKYKADLSERVCVASFGYAGERLTELNAGEEYGAPEEPKAGAAFATPAQALEAREFAPLLQLLPAALPNTARGLEVCALDHDGAVYWVAWVARGGRWQLRFAYHTTLQERLQRAREDALRRIREAARAWVERRQTWPAAAELGLRAQDWVDAASESGERGWQQYAPEPRAGFSLVKQSTLPPRPEEAVALTLDGKFGIGWDGRFLTVPK